MSLILVQDLIQFFKFQFLAGSSFSRILNNSYFCTEIPSRFANVEIRYSIFRFLTKSLAEKDDLSNSKAYCKSS